MLGSCPLGIAWGRRKEKTTKKTKKIKKKNKKKKKKRNTNTKRKNTETTKTNNNRNVVVCDSVWKGIAMQAYAEDNRNRSV